MCIDDNFTIIKNHPKYGEIVEAIESEFNCCYILRGYEIDPNGALNRFKKRRFIPLSDIDEAELVKEREVVC